MKRTLTITFEFDDGPWFAKDEEVWYPTDAIAFAMDQVNGAVPYASGADFINAKLDDEVLVDRTGYVSEEVKKREVQHRAFLEKVASSFSDQEKGSAL